MNVDDALLVAHINARRVGVHACADPECQLCAVRVLADEVRRLRNRESKKCSFCGSLLIDGLCVRCNA